MLHNVAPVAHKTPQKITIVGVGAVGMACAYSILQQVNQNHVSEGVDVAENKVKGEMMDLQHGQAFTGRTVIRADTKYDITDHSKLCIITAGLRQKIGETRLSLVQRNTDVFKKIIPELVKRSPETILLVVANPGFVTLSLRNSIYLRHPAMDGLLESTVTLAQESLTLNLISVPVWSGVNVAGISITSVSKQVSSHMSSEAWEEDIHKKVIDSAYEIIKMKGYTCWGIGLAVAKIAKGVMRNSRNIYALSINVKGMHGITDDVFLSLPCVLGIGGITQIVRQDLNQEEIAKLHKSWKTLYEVQKQIKF
ncbi:unnamed protein product [Cylicocyclus nassatus]|uniref:L-lactate dehydrogenase n=1 Tax=Cylicocyclus nassatus TaxID=53992 RepID=A0AA36M8R7_CYLNA|nr:unnamed protein product [Cylicocyclus nassatus]